MRKEVGDGEWPGQQTCAIFSKGADRPDYAGVIVGDSVGRALWRYARR